MILRYSTLLLQEICFKFSEFRNVTISGRPVNPEIGCQSKGPMFSRLLGSLLVFVRENQEPGKKHVALTF